MKPRTSREKLKLNEFKQVSGEVSGTVTRTEKEACRDDREYQARCGSCGRLLGTFRIASGVIKCPRCKHVQEIHIGRQVQKNRAA